MWTTQAYSQAWPLYLWSTSCLPSWLASNYRQNSWWAAPALVAEIVLLWLCRSLMGSLASAALVEVVSSLGFLLASGALSEFEAELARQRSGQVAVNRPIFQWSLAGMLYGIASIAISVSLARLLNRIDEIPNLAEVKYVCVAKGLLWAVISAIYLRPPRPQWRSILTKLLFLAPLFLIFFICTIPFNIVSGLLLILCFQLPLMSVTLTWLSGLPKLEGK